MSQDLEKRTREVLEESTARLDGRTLSRLTQARHAALDQLQQPVHRRWSRFVPAVDMLADSDAPVFAEGDDLEFYEWAADEIDT
jgi:hypothetical protein